MPYYLKSINVKIWCYCHMKCRELGYARIAAFECYIIQLDIKKAAQKLRKLTIDTLLCL